MEETVDASKGAPRPVPPSDGYTVDDLFTLPDLPPHTELIDGRPVFRSPQQDFHSVMVDLLVSGLRDTRPPDLSVERQMTVILTGVTPPNPMYRSSAPKRSPAWSRTVSRSRVSSWP